MFKIKIFILKDTRQTKHFRQRKKPEYICLPRIEKLIIEIYMINMTL